MSKNIKISIIVPVYNVEEYLHDCLNSVLNQNLPEIEIICIDDCSNDSSSEILKYFKDKDNRIKIFENKEKLGLNYSYTIGIQQAQGDYILLLKSKDWLDKNCLKSLHDKINYEKTDVLLFKSMKFNQEKKVFINTEHKSKNYYKNMGKPFNYKTTTPDLLFSLSDSSVKQLCKTELIKEIIFPKERLYCNSIIYFEIMFKAKKIIMTDDYFYNERIIDLNSNATNIKRIEILETSNQIISFFLENNLYPEYKNKLLNYIIHNIKTNYDLIDKQYKKLFYKKIRETIKKFNEIYLLKNDFKNNLNKENLDFYTKLNN